MIQNVTGDPFYESRLIERIDEMGGYVPPGYVPYIRP